MFFGVGLMIFQEKKLPSKKVHRNRNVDYSML